MNSRIVAALSVLVACALGFLIANPDVVLPQSSPGLRQGQVPTAAQWNSYFAAKQDFVGGTPLSISGGTMTGELVFAAATASFASFNLPPGAAPSSPVNGDMWTTSAGVFARVNGSTVNLTTQSTGLSTTGGTMTGELVTAVPTTGTSMLNLPHGTSPSAPVNGDLWTTSAGFFARINGVTINMSNITAGQLPAFGSGDVSFASGGGAGTIAANAVTKAKLANASAQNTVIGSATSTAAADLAVPSCSTASSALSWTSNTGFGCNTITGGTGTALKHQVFTSSGSFTIPSGTVSTTLFKFTITGGGGNGGTGSAVGGGNGGAGGAGAGGTAINFLSGLTAGNTITVTVGGAATASSISSGTQSITTVTGAAGGAGGAAANTPVVGVGGAAGGGGSTTNAEISIPGGDGMPGSIGDTLAAFSGRGGNGGGSYWGGGGAGAASNGSAAGTVGKAFGSGGGGGTNGGGGGGGKAGIVLVEWVL